MISKNREKQYISVSQYACDVEKDPCKWVHNSSPNGKGDIQKDLPQCVADDKAVSNAIPEPFKIDVDGGACSGSSSACDAAGWVYCQDAQCWQPTNGDVSSLPGSNAGASCVINAQNPSWNLPATGKDMCDAMKAGALFSTWGPEGWKPPLVISECPARTPWAWCWGAPCEFRDGDVICDCPVMISDNAQPQLLSLSQFECDKENNGRQSPCGFMHNGSPNGAKDVQRYMATCDPVYGGNNFKNTTQSSDQ